jgi:hypothetical protein
MNVDIMAVIPTAQFHDSVKRNGSLQIVSSNSRLVREERKLLPFDPHGYSNVYSTSP